jgi:hypothetical protein
MLLFLITVNIPFVLEYWREGVPLFSIISDFETWMEAEMGHIFIASHHFLVIVLLFLPFHHYHF